MRPKQLPLFAILFALALQPLADAWAATSATLKPFSRGTYNAALSGDDTVTMEGNVVIEGESSVPALVGEVIMTEKAVTWKGREATEEVFYTVWGSWKPGGGGTGGGGGSGSGGWYAWYDAEGGARIVLLPQVGDLAGVEMWPKDGTENRLYVGLLGAEAGKSYDIQLYVSDESIATFTPMDFTLTKGSAWKLVNVNALKVGSIQIQACCTNQEDVTEASLDMEVGDFLPRDPDDSLTDTTWTPNASMWDQGGDWEDRTIDSKTYKYCKFGGQQALKAVGLTDKDFCQVTEDEVDDSFDKSDAVMWRCDKAWDGAPERGSCSPKFGMVTVWEGADSDQPYLYKGASGIPSCGIILDIKDDGAKAKDTEPTLSQVPSGYDGPRADKYQPGYFQVQSMVVRYFQPGEIKQVTLIDHDTTGRTATDFLEVVASELQGNQIDFVAELVEGAEPLDNTKWPKWYLSTDGGAFQELTDFKGQMSGDFKAYPGLPCQQTQWFGGVRKYTLKVEWANTTEPDNVKMLQHTISAYHTDKIDVEIPSKIVDLITKTKETFDLLKAKAQDPPPGEWFQTMSDSKVSLKATGMGWAERLPSDQDGKPNEVLYVLKIKVDWSPIIGFDMPDNLLKFPTPITGVFIRGDINGSFGMSGEFFRNENNTKGNGGVRGTAKVGAMFGVSAGSEWVVEVMGGAETGFTGSAFLGGVPVKSQDKDGVGLEGDVQWDGLHLFVEATSLGGYGPGGKQSWQVLKSRQLWGPKHWTLISFNSGKGK